METNEDNLRFREREVKLSNQEIIELAYTTKETIEYAYGKKLCFEQANGYRGSFYIIRELLKQVDDEYLSLSQHTGLKDFFHKD